MLPQPRDAEDTCPVGSNMRVSICTECGCGPSAVACRPAFSPEHAGKALDPTARQAARDQALAGGAQIATMVGSSQTAANGRRRLAQRERLEDSQSRAEDGENQLECWQHAGCSGSYSEVRQVGGHAQRQEDQQKHARHDVVLREKHHTNVNSSFSGVSLFRCNRGAARYPQ